MSRHVKVLSRSLSIAYGYDHALGYFFQVFDDIRDPDMPIIDECSTLTHLTKGKMLDLMQEYNASKDHIEYVAFDLPF